MAAGMTELGRISAAIVGCERCPRLRRYCARVARKKRAAFAEEVYWGRPVPGFGDPGARLWIVGLAPGAHGANRTGRVFTGDRSGDFLFAALHRAGFANQATSRAAGDGLVLRDCFISAAARCAPPGNRPLPVELERCASFLDAEWEMLGRKRVILALGKIAWDAVGRMVRRKGAGEVKRAFGHGVVVELGRGLRVMGSYHVSQQNTFTGRLTEGMFDEVLGLARAGLR